MKFNFEKFKKMATKTAIGAGVVSASLGNLEAQEIKSNQKEKEINKTEMISNTTQNQTEKESIKQQTDSLRLEKIKEIENDLGISKENKNLDKDNPEYYRNKYLEYIKHPSYKERLAKEMFGDEVIDEEKQKWVNKEYEERLDQIKIVPIKLNENIEHSEYNPQTNKIETKKEDIFHEISHSVDNNFPKNPEEFRPSPDKGFTFKKREVLSSTKDGLFQNKIDSLSLKNPDDLAITGLNRIIYYLQNNSELRARLNHLRMSAIENYNFNLNNDFNINDFYKLKEDEQYIELKKGLGLSDEQINELMKYTAMNEKEEGKGNYYNPNWNYNNKNDKA